MEEVFRKAERWTWLSCGVEQVRCFIIDKRMRCEAEALLRRRHSYAHATGHSWVLTVQLVSAIKASTTFPMCSLKLRSATPRGISISAICGSKTVSDGVQHKQQVIK